jgi:hypothetical protein
MTQANAAPATLAAKAPTGPALDGLATGLRGRLIVPGDEAYDAARTVFYGGYDKRPAAIVRAADAGDVALAVRLAAKAGLEVAVRSGGHSVAGHSTTDGGLVIDLGAMKALTIDPATRTAWAEPGLTAVAFTKAAAEHGLAVGFGDAGSVGVGGITLGGGVGFLARKHGLTIDSLLAAEIVTAEGEVAFTDADTLPDLFWAIRGGGGNFGIATRLKFRLHELGQVVGGMLILPATADTIAGFIALADAAGDDLSTIANVMPCPPLPFVPAETHGQLVIFASLVHAEGGAAAQAALAPFRALAPPIADMLRPMALADMYPPDGGGYHPTAVSTTMFIDHVDRATARTILDHLSKSDANIRVAQLRVLGGAVSRVPADATAYAHRQSRMMVNLAAFYDGPETRRVRQAWVDTFAAAIRQNDAGAYVGFIGDEGEERIGAAYPGPTRERLARVKARFDPENLFRLNQNIRPSAT